MKSFISDAHLYRIIRIDIRKSAIPAISSAGKNYDVKCYCLEKKTTTIHMENCSFLHAEYVL